MLKKIALILSIIIDKYRTIKVNTMSSENFDRTLFVDNPEVFFDRDDLIYKTSEIEVILLQFSSVMQPKPVYTAITHLLEAVKDFRQRTQPTGRFAELRNQLKSDADCELIFINMNKAFEKAEAELSQLKDEKDKSALSKAIHYSKQHILQRVSQWVPEDRLNDIWQKSSLKNKITS